MIIANLPYFLNRSSSVIIKVIYLALFLLCSCTLEPKYKTPKANIPLLASDGQIEAANIAWQDFFLSSDLQRVINLALENNNDLKTAVLNIELAQSIHGLARSNLFPNLNLTASETNKKSVKKQYQTNLAMTSYELDFFGKLRSLKKAALENFLATEEAANVVKIALISETANSYAQLLLDSEILKIADQNLINQQERYNLAKLRYENNIDAKDKLLNAEALLENAKLVRETYLKLVNQDQNALMALTGVFDSKSLPHDQKIKDIKINEKIFKSCPSQSLLARPDIKAAEHYLKMANANIGAARAAFFPSLTLTGSVGYASNDLNNLFSSGAWSFIPQVNLPIFNGGRNLANLKIANLQKKIEIIQYQKTIQNAFREALDQLAERKYAVNNLHSYNQILSLNQKNYDISQAKYQNGINNKLEVLDAKTNLLLASQYQAIVQKEYIANLINLYKVLGGGSNIKKHL